MQPNVTSGISTEMMRSEEIREKFYQIAQFAINPDVALLIRQLGDLMYAQFITQRDSIAAIDNMIKQLQTVHEQRTAHLIDRAHNLSNRFMAVENKVDETIELIDLKLEEILAAVTNANDNERSTTD